MGEETSPCLLTLTTFFRWKRVVSKVGDFYDPQCHLLMACYQSDFEMVKFLLGLFLFFFLFFFFLVFHPKKSIDFQSYD